MEKEYRFVLDTSLFTNPNVRKSFGSTAVEALKNFLKIASQTRYHFFYMPLSIKRELIHFMNNEEVPFLEAVITIKNPNLHSLSVPAPVVYKFIDEIRNRIDKGLRVSEELIRTERDQPEAIHRLREKYRSVLRDGIVDSKEDFDVLMLATEIDGLIVTADTGLMNMAEWLGLSFVPAERFHELLIYSSKQQPLFES